MRLDEADRFKTAFSSPIGTYQFKVTSFGLKNSSRHFCHVMSIVFEGTKYNFLVLFIDDVVVASENVDQHAMHLQLFLARIKEFNLVLKLKKTKIGRNECFFLGCHIKQGMISVSEEKSRIIQQWPEPKNAQQMRSYLGLWNFFRRAVPNAASIIGKLTDQTKKNVVFKFGPEEKQAFSNSKAALAKTMWLTLPDPNEPFEVYCDASDAQVGAVLIQHGRPVEFFSKRLVGAEIMYPIRDKEIYSIVLALKQWKSTLLGSTYTIFTDHKTILFLCSQEERSPRQVRWLSELSPFGKWNVKYLEGEKNIVADALSRVAMPDEPAKPDSVIHILAVTINQESEAKVVRAPAEHFQQGVPQAKFALVVSVIEFVPNTDFLSKVKEASQKDTDLQQMATRNELHFKWEEDILYYSESTHFDLDRRMVIPNDDILKGIVFSENHDSILASHKGARQTYIKIAHNFFWPHLRRDVNLYCATCSQCQKNKYSTQKKQGFLQQTQLANGSNVTMTMDFVTSLPKDSGGFDEIMCVIDKFSKRTWYIPTTSKATAYETAELFLTRVVAERGLCENIISDRDPILTAQHFKQLMSFLGVQLASTVSKRANSDGQSERGIRVLREAMRPYIDKNHTNWRKLLPWLMLSVNNAVATSTGFSPIMLECGHAARLPSDVLMRVSNPDLFDVQEHFNEITANIREAKDNMLMAFDSQAKHFNEHRAPSKINVNDWVLVSNSRLLDLSEKDIPYRKLSPLLAGPFRVTAKPFLNVAVLALPMSSKVHSTFNVDQLKQYRPSPARFNSRPRNDPSSIDEDGEFMYTVECVVDRRLVVKDNSYEYLLKYLDYSADENCWVPRDALTDCIPDMIDDYDSIFPFPEPVSAPKKGKVGRPRKT
jgi:hypothetical protein